MDHASFNFGYNMNYVIDVIELIEEHNPISSKDSANAYFQYLDYKN